MILKNIFFVMDKDMWQKLSFRPGHGFLPDNFSLCEQGLKKLKNFLTSENLAEKYDEIFKEYGQNKIIKKVPFNEVPKKSGQVHYLPHQPVLREDKETTKIRAVCDASCASDGPSLNDCAYSGPIYFQRYLTSYYGLDLTLLLF